MASRFTSIAIIVIIIASAGVYINTLANDFVYDDLFQVRKNEWFLITISPTLGRAGLVLMADRYLYIPSLGLCLLGGLFFSKIYHLSSEFRVRSLLLLPLILLFIVTVERNRLWKDEVTYFKKAVEDAPECRGPLQPWNSTGGVRGDKEGCISLQNVCRTCPGGI